MKTILKAYTAFAVCAVVLSAANSYAQASREPAKKKVDVFATARAGQWVKLKGELQRDLTFVATKMKFLPGDLLDEEWEVSGKVLAIDKPKNEISVVRQWPIKCQADTEFEDLYDNTMTINKLAAGKAIKVKGTYLKDGTFLASKVKEDRIKASEGPNRVTFVGKIEKVDPAGKSIQLMGITFYVSDMTKGKLAAN